MTEVLLVEDDPAARQGLELALRRLGYGVRRGGAPARPPRSADVAHPGALGALRCRPGYGCVHHRIWASIGISTCPDALRGGSEALSRLHLDERRYGLDERQVGERLREVPQVLARGGVDFLGVKLERPGEGQQLLAQGAPSRCR